MTQPAMPLPMPMPMTMANGTPGSLSAESSQPVMSGKRKRDADAENDGEAMDVDVDVDMNGGDDDNQNDQNDQKPAATNGDAERAETRLIQAFFEVLSSFDVQPPILKRPLSEPSSKEEPDAKRQKSADLAATSTIAAKVAANAYEHLEDLEEDLVSVVQSAIDELKTASSQDSADAAEGDAKRDAKGDAVEQLAAFKGKALKLIRQEKAYPRTSSEPVPTGADMSKKSEMVLSLIGFAPQERRLFSSLPASHGLDLSELHLPQGVSLTQVMPSTHQDRTQTLGELFSSPRTLPPLQPPKQPKSQARGTTLDFYHPELTDHSKYRSNTYFTTKLAAGHYLDYSNATPSSQIQTKQRERAQSLAGRKPSIVELEMSEMESLFRGAFSSFAPCKDDTAAIVPSSVAGRLWWQRTGQRQFQNMIEVEYYGGGNGNEKADAATKAVELDESALREALDNWDETVVDPSLEEIMGSNKKKEEEKELDEILDEVSDMIETLSSYQRIRNLTLPSSQNRQSSDPVTGDMLATAGPQPSEAEQATYQMLKAQLALIIKTLPPYAVSKLNGDQLEDLLISTKVQVHTDQYRGVMEEDETALQARLRAQQAAHANARPPVPQRTPSVPAVSFAPQYQPTQQYSTPARPVPQQYYRPGGVTPSYQPPQRPMPPAQPRLPQPNQYTRPSGYQSQFATQLAKAQTPYGHQNLPQFASQQRPPYGQLPPQQATPTRFSYQSSFPPQQPSTPSQGAYGAYTNGAGMPPRNMSPQVQQHRQSYSPSPNMQQAQRYGTPNPSMSSQMGRFSSNPSQSVPPPPPPNPNPGLTGYHTVIPEAQQQRILDQAKARAAAHERSAIFGDKMTQPNPAPPPLGMASSLNVFRTAPPAQQQQKPVVPGLNQRPGMNGTPGGPHIPHKVTPVPVPPIPGLPQQRQPST